MMPTFFQNVISHYQLSVKKTQKSKNWIFPLKKHINIVNVPYVMSISRKHPKWYCFLPNVFITSNANTNLKINDHDIFQNDKILGKEEGCADKASHGDFSITKENLRVTLCLILIFP